MDEATPAPDRAQLITEECMIPGGDAGTLLHVRNKRPDGLTRFNADTPPYMAQALFPQLVNTPYKRLVMIG